LRFLPTIEKKVGDKKLIFSTSLNDQGLTLLVVVEYSQLLKIPGFNELMIFAQGDMMTTSFGKVLVRLKKGGHWTEWPATLS
jgi:hypothetical protein